MVNLLAGVRITKRLSSLRFRKFRTFNYHQGARVTHATKASPPSPTTSRPTPVSENIAKTLKKVSRKESALPSHLLDTPKAISGMVDKLSDLSKSPSLAPQIYMDIEGVNLCRYGTVSILQVYVRATDRAHLVDVLKLGKAAFETKGTRTPHTLQSILESEDIPKVFFDVRRDSDALYHHFNIKLRGIHDLQLMELATRKTGRAAVAGLRRCIASNLFMRAAERRSWMAVKEAGATLFDPEKGGSFEAFNERPLPAAIIAYCIQDVLYLPPLWDRYSTRIKTRWRTKIDEATKARVRESQAEDYVPKGKHMLLPPPGW
ncbi:ribonuclease H-like domain-containing protein [Nemania sp. NC0429]|nr:ribonuclease H-like domain-containing protein [Nemania sp. NC0429]